MAQTLLRYAEGKGRCGMGGPILILLILIFAVTESSYSQSDSIFRLPAGTRIRLKLDAELNSRVASVDDTFLAFVATPLSVRDAVVLPAGTQIEGRIIEVRRAGGWGRNGNLELLFETLTLTGRTRHIDAMLTAPLSRPHSRSRLFAVLGGVAAGSVVGGAIGSVPGAAVGAAAGAGVGTAAAVLKRGSEARLRRGEEFEIELRSPVDLPMDDY